MLRSETSRQHCARGPQSSLAAEAEHEPEFGAELGVGRMSGGGLSGEDKVLDLVGSIYDAALDAQLWPDVLNRIGDAVGGPLVVFGFYDPANAIVSMQAPRSDPDVLRSFEDWT